MQSVALNLINKKNPFSRRNEKGFLFFVEFTFLDIHEQFWIYGRIIFMNFVMQMWSG